MTQSLLNGLNVLELGEGVSAAYCAKLLGAAWRAGGQGRAAGG